MMHTVIADECTGCELCLPPCPVDCIDLVPRRRPFIWSVDTVEVESREALEPAKTEREHA